MEYKKQINKDDGFLTCREVADYFRVSTQTIREWIALGKIEPAGCFQIGKHGRWRIYKSALEKAQRFSTGGMRASWTNSFQSKSL